MPIPQLELIPLRAAVSSERPWKQDVLVRVAVPAIPGNLKRPPINLSLVIDRSSSMQGRKIELARQAACYAVQQLLPTDRISITTFDREVRILVPNTLAVDKENIIRQLQQVQTGLGTALHAGWQAGAVQAIKRLQAEQLNRVILLSDGFASVGERNPEVILSDVHDLAKQGVSTSAIGVGNAYDENLLLAIACRGDGKYYYGESAQQLPEIFQTELQTLMATIGHNVSLGIEPQGDIELDEVLNDLEVDRCGRFQLPNLVMGNTFQVVVRLRTVSIPQVVIPSSLKQSVDAVVQSSVYFNEVVEKTPLNLCYFRLTWMNPQHHEQQKIRVLLSLPLLSSGQMMEFPANPEVEQQVALLLSARAKKKAVHQLDLGQYETANHFLQEARQLILNAPNSPTMQQEIANLAALNAHLQARQLRKLRKQASYESYRTQFTSGPMTDKS